VPQVGQRVPVVGRPHSMQGRRAIVGFSSPEASARRGWAAGPWAWCPVVGPGVA